MRSVVIHIKKKPQEWHLVESLFYKVQASKQLIFLELNQSELYGNWDQLYKQVLTYLLQNRFDHWQLILLNNHEPHSLNRTSLTKELYLIKEKLLKPLSEKGVVPSRRLMLTLDGLIRHADHSPEDFNNHLKWQIDYFGYIKDINKGKLANMFVEEEILSIDQGWGELINLKDAGIIEDPNETFLQDLKKRKQMVKGYLRKLIKEKQQYVDQMIWESDIEYHDILSKEMLETIYKEFCNQLDEMCMPPFSYHLSTFLPSNQLKTILKENIGIPSVIGDFLLIRKTNSEYSPFQKIRTLLEYSFLLNAVVLEPEVLDRVGNGFCYEAELVLRDEEIKQMYANYYTCLETAKEKLENRSLDQEHFMMNKYADINSLPYSAPPLDMNGTDSPVFKAKYSSSFISDWYLFLNGIEGELEARAEASIESAKEGIKVLAVTKRQRHDHFLQESININDYKESMIRTKNQLQSEIDDVAPSLTKVIEKWKKLLPSLNERMQTLVNSFPSQNIIITAFLVAFFSLLFPYLTSIQTNNSQSGAPTFLQYGIMSLVLLMTISTLCFLAFRKLVKPIEALSDEAVSIQKSLATEQMLAHSQYNNYLNRIYKLFRMRNQYRDLEEKEARQKEENILYRWHQREIQNHITILNQLVDSLQLEVQLEQKEKCITFFNSTFNVNKSLYRNPIYSPLDCQFDKVLKGHSLEVYVVNSRDEITTWTLNPIEKIRFSQDKVYSL